jgi:serine/threonine protein kinase
MDGDGHICLTDFGLAKQVDPDNPFASTFVGTPDYIGKFFLKSKCRF